MKEFFINIGEIRGRINFGGRIKSFILNMLIFKRLFDIRGNMFIIYKNEFGIYRVDKN